MFSSFRFDKSSFRFSFIHLYSSLQSSNLMMYNLSSTAIFSTFRTIPFCMRIIKTFNFKNKDELSIKNICITLQLRQLSSRIKEHSRHLFMRTERNEPHRITDYHNCNIKRYKSFCSLPSTKHKCSAQNTVSSNAISVILASE